MNCSSILVIYKPSEIRHCYDSEHSLHRHGSSGPSLFCWFEIKSWDYLNIVFIGLQPALQYYKAWPKPQAQSIKNRSTRRSSKHWCHSDQPHVGCGYKDYSHSIRCQPVVDYDWTSDVLQLMWWIFSQDFETLDEEMIGRCFVCGSMLRTSKLSTLLRASKIDWADHFFGHAVKNELFQDLSAGCGGHVCSRPVGNIFLQHSGQYLRLD